MSVFLVDVETGESLGPGPLRGCSADGSEPLLDPTSPVNNAETGEPEDVTENLSHRRVPFQIPRELQQQPTSRKGGSRSRKALSEIEPVPSGTPFGQTNPIMLFLPVVFYFRWVVAILMCVEVALHVWAHHKNKRLKNSAMYFRSPFHSISSEFCAICQSEMCMDRVGKMQEIRTHKILRQCNYMKRVVT